ncbi:MAG: TonB-dependent receptor [Balneolaceae bacterium]
MRSFKRILPTALVLVFFTNLLFAQGSLRGVVTDQFDDEPLYGASIFIVGTSLGTSTDFNGQYRVRRVPAGEIQIRFSYIGYETQTIDTTIADGETIELNVALRASSIEGDEVNITAQAAGQVAAINQQRASNTIINVVSEDKIQELPDANAAESIGRLPGVSLSRSGGEANKVILRGLSDKYLNVTIDGVKLPATDALGRGLDLSAISQNSLSGIELYKAVTPDKDADAIAGSINLVTRKAPKERELRVTAKGGYNYIMNSFGQYDLSAKYSDRFYDNLLGVQAHGNLENKIRSNERILVGYNTEVDNHTSYAINNLDLEFIDENRLRNGLGVILDVNTPDEGNVKLSSMYSSTTRDYLTHERNYPRTTASVTYTYRDREQQIDVLSNSLIGKNYLLGLETDWVVSYSRSEAYYPYDFEATFFEPSVEGSGMMAGMPGDLKTNPEIFTEYAFNNFQTAAIDDAYYRTQDNSDAEFTAKIDLLKEYSISNAISGEIKTGGKFSSKDRQNEHTRTYSPYRLGAWQPYEMLPDGSIVDKDFSGTYFEDFYQIYLQNPSYGQPSFRNFLAGNPESKIILDNFNMNPLIDRDKMRQWYELNRYGTNQSGTTPEYYNDPTATANNYDITESVTAGYLMNTINFGQSVTAVMGARIEHESHDYINTYSPRQIGGFPVPVGSTRDTSSTYSETIILPNLHVNIEPTNFLNIRLAAYRALARPDFNMRLLSYFAWRDSHTGGERILVLGNPKLKTAKAWNYEVNTSLYGNKIGLFSVSAFYKQIDDMYHMLNGIRTSGDTLISSLNLDWSSPHSASYELTVPYNSPDPSYVWGFEIDHQINFIWAPGLLSNIVLSYNASLVYSETSLIGSRTDTTFIDHDDGLGPRPSYSIRQISTTQKLENQPDMFGNVSLGYDIGGFSGRISLFHQSEYYRSYSPDERSDQIVGAYSRVDLALKYRITDYLMVVSNVNNLTNIKETNLRHNQINGYKIPTATERYGLTFDFGIQLEL